jgi:cell fate (sporulation/competence/biofilm development) regulator YlbF (YheA/YmcA/DUF963 family)
MPVSVARGDVVGIGKIKIPRTREFNYEIPMLSFIVIEDKKGSFVSTCIHLQMDGYGSAPDLAVDDMGECIYHFLRQNFDKLSREDAWFNLKDLFHADDNMSELWDAYRDVQLDLATNDISTDNVANLKRKIMQLQRRINELESKNAQLEKKISDVRELIVDYISVQAA